MRISLILIGAILITSCSKSDKSSNKEDETKVTEEFPEVTKPKNPVLPPDISSTTTRISDGAECKLTYSTWGDMKRSYTERAKLEYRDDKEIKSNLYELPFGGTCTLRIPRSVRSMLEPTLFSIIILNDDNKVVARPILEDMRISPNDYGSFYADASFDISEYIAPSFSIHVVDIVTKKKSVFLIRKAN